MAGIQNKKKRRDHADAVIRVMVSPDDPEGSHEAHKEALFESLREIDRLNDLRRGRGKLGPWEVAFLDPAGNSVYVLPISGEPKWDFEKKIDPTHFPNFAYVVATDGRGRKIVVRIEFESVTVQ